MSDKYPDKCGLCASPAYIGLNLTECSNCTCSNHETPKEEQPVPALESFDEEADETTEPRVNLWDYPSSQTGTAGARPSALPGDAHKHSKKVSFVDAVQIELDNHYHRTFGTDQDSLSTGTSTKPVTPSTPLSEVHDSLREGEKSQFQSLVDCIGNFHADLSYLRDCLEQANGQTMHLKHGTPVSRIPPALSDLLDNLPELEDTLEQCDQFFRKLQNE